MRYGQFFRQLSSLGRRRPWTKFWRLHVRGSGLKGAPWGARLTMRQWHSDNGSVLAVDGTEGKCRRKRLRKSCVTCRFSIDQLQCRQSFTWVFMQVYYKWWVYLTWVSISALTPLGWWNLELVGKNVKLYVICPCSLAITSIATYIHMHNWLIPS